ncbi:MAG: hypothetical protein ABIL70_03675 [candidate division WOR-3 bacterium]
MEFLKKLKKDKKAESVFDLLIEKKQKKEEIEERPPDMEVTEISPEKAPPPVIQEKPEPTPKREFRTEGMHEFDIESLGASTSAGLKIEYKARIVALIDEDKIDEAIALLQELKEKLKGL